MTRKPTGPGEILSEEFLRPLGMTQQRLAAHLGCDVKVVNRIVNGRTSVSSEMALKLAATFRTSPEMWLNAQKAVDLYEALGHLRGARPSATPSQAAAGGGLTERADIAQSAGHHCSAAAPAPASQGPPNLRCVTAGR